MELADACVPILWSLSSSSSYHPSSDPKQAFSFYSWLAMDDNNADADPQAIYSFWPLRDALVFKVGT